jgi:hypothetical protein
MIRRAAFEVQVQVESFKMARRRRSNTGDGRTTLNGTHALIMFRNRSTFLAMALCIAMTFVLQTVHATTSTKWQGVRVHGRHHHGQLRQTHNNLRRMYSRRTTFLPVQCTLNEHQQCSVPRWLPWWYEEEHLAHYFHSEENNAHTVLSSSPLPTETKIGGDTLELEEQDERNFGLGFYLEESAAEAVMDFAVNAVLFHEGESSVPDSHNDENNVLADAPANAQAPSSAKRRPQREGLWRVLAERALASHPPEFSIGGYHLRRIYVRHVTRPKHKHIHFLNDLFHDVVVPSGEVLPTFVDISVLYIPDDETFGCCAEKAKKVERNIEAAATTRIVYCDIRF